MYEDILLNVRKPAQYIGQEWNVSRKDFAEADLRFALCFPDLYEVGMSNLGIRIIYGIVNKIEGAVCERFFAPDMDMAKALKDNSREILSLETRKRLSEFDIIGFSLGSELDYTNVLAILDLGAIPLESSQRANNFPLVIGGGPCTLNPEPMHEFFDLFVIGEGEEVVRNIISVYRSNKQAYRSSGMSKQDLLLAFSAIEGVYVPSLYDVEYDGMSRITEFKPKVAGVPARIKKSFVKDLNSSFFPSEWLLPYIQTIHDRITVEIMRGCPNKCRFCQGRTNYFPYRVRKIEKIVDLANEAFKCTGYEEIALGGLSVSDYPGIEELSMKLADLFTGKGVSVSLPSLKARTVVGNLSSVIAKVKKTGLTFAPESGTERLREILSKDFSEEDFFKALEEAYSSGYRHVKLYFMIGLPFEETRDLDGIIEFSSRASELKRKINRSAAQVNISINQLIPKPHTAFQWLEMENLEGIRHKQGYLRGKIKSFKLALSFHNPLMSFLEGVLSRGDRRLSKVISLAFKKGARFDAWSNYFSFDAWMSAFSDSGIDPNFYLRSIAKDEILPWDHIDTGISKSLLLSEFDKLVAT